MTFDPGQKIGAYRIIRLLGEGGMGAVYEVEHVELGTHYALKTFIYDTSDDYGDLLLNKFREEAKMLSRINHPYVSRAFDLTYDKEQGVLYYVMDLVLYKDGESYSLGEVDRETLSEDLVYCWFCDACEALDHIHSIGIVHRAVKLDNFLLNADKHAVLADFGVSRIFGAQMQKDVAPYKTMRIKLNGSTEKTVLGSDHYIAPEVLAGQEATPAADAYGLGVMIFKLFTDEWADKKSPAQVGAFLHGYKFRWYNVIPKLVEFDPAQRPTQLVDLIPLLDRQAAPAVVKGEPPVSAKAKQNKRRKKLFENVFAAILGLFVVGVIGAAGWFGWQYTEKRNAENRRAQQAQLDAMRKRLDERPQVVTNTVKEVVKVVEKKKAMKTLPPPVVVETPGDEEVKVEGEKKTDNSASPKSEKMVIVKDETDAEEVDYGPIPNVTYRWFSGKGNENPLRVNFQMANGAKIELMPMKKGVFYMSNNWDDKKARHKVTLTRPFWVSKFCVTAAQWREYCPGECEDCRLFEKAVPNGVFVYRRFHYQRIQSFCKYLTLKYRSQLPSGYVFRLPTEAECEACYASEQNYLALGKQWDAEYPQRIDSLIKRLNVLGQFNRGGKSLENFSIILGGVRKPRFNGFCDLDVPYMTLLDTWPVDAPHVRYEQEEIDPIHQIKSGDFCVLNWNSGNRCFDRKTNRFIFHLAVAVDVNELTHIREQIVPDNNVRVAPEHRYSWNPTSVPKMIKKPKELTFKMVDGGDMVFCTIPAGTFNMSSPDGQDKLYHKVTLTRPFWISKYCVTTKQWREYAKHDCEGLVRQVEKCFPKNPIYLPFTRPQWDGFCEYLNKRYGRQLPKDYVFRLPTEAEWEWAFVGEKDGDMRQMKGCFFNNCDKRFRVEFTDLLKKLKISSALPFNNEGWMDSPFRRMYVGGRVDCTKTFGVCDMYVAHSDGGPAVFVFDSYDSDGFEEENGSVNWFAETRIGFRDCHYCDVEVDPVRYAGRLATHLMKRKSGAARLLSPTSFQAYAHIVVGPDVEQPLAKKEVEPYSEEDFGGKLMSDDIANGGQSSKFEENPSVPWRNTEERFKRMLSSENTLIEAVDLHKDVRGFHTQKEDSPWIQLNLGKRRVITGLQIDALNDAWSYNWVRHLRVWTSEDGKIWREVAAENQRKHRYRFDLQRKNVTAKFIRIGREPGFMKDFFSLDKILVYGR